jgi:hypothetical protein
MATTEELLAEKAKLEKQIAAVRKVDVTTTTAAQRLKSMKSTEVARKRLAEINSQLAGRPQAKSGKDAKGKTISEVKQGLEANKKVADNAPAFIAGDALDDLANWADFDFRNNASFMAGGAGSTAFVYLGEMDNPNFKGGLQFKGGVPIPKKIDQSRLGTALVNDFWNDKALQSKIVGAYASKGQTISTLQAYEVWQGLVSTAQSIYQGGRGAKVTPMQLLTDSLKGIKGKDTGPDVTQYISVKTDDEIKQTLKSAIFSYIQKEPKDDDPVFSKLVKDIKNLYAKGSTQTSTVNPKTGKKTVVEKGGVTAGDIEARIERAYKGTDDFLEAKSLEGADLFSQWMRS